MKLLFLICLGMLIFQPYSVFAQKEPPSGGSNPGEDRPSNPPGGNPGPKEETGEGGSDPGIELPNTPRAPRAPERRPQTNGNNGNVTIPDYAGSNSCDFKPQMTADDANLMNRARSVIAQLRNNPGCSLPPDFQISTLETAIAQFNTSANISGAGGYPGSVPTNCFTYNSDLDRMFNQFVRNVNGARVHFNTCRQEVEADAIECAANEVVLQKSRISQLCETFETSTAGRERVNALTTALGSTVDTLSGLIANPNCANSDARLRRGLLDVGLELSSRATSFLGLTGAAGLAVGSITQLAQNAIQALFNRNNDEDDPNVQTEITNNFRNLACTYTEIEKRARNCNRIEMRQNLEALRPIHERDCATEVAPAVSLTEFFAGLEPIVNEIRPEDNTDPTPGETGDGGNTNPTIALILGLNTPYSPDAGTNTYLGLGGESAQGIVSYVDSFLGADGNNTDEMIQRQMEAQGIPVENVFSAGLFKQELIVQKNRANRVSAILLKMEQSLNPQESNRQARLEEVNQLIKSYDGNFLEELAQVIQEGARISGNIGDQVDSHNASVALLARKENYERIQRELTKDDTVGVDFATQLEIIRPELQNLSRSFLDIIKSRLDDAGKDPTEMEETRQTLWEGSILPAILTCNNLQSALTDDNERFTKSRGGQISAAPLHPLCSKFNCPNGIKTFADYLNARGVGQNFKTACDDNNDCGTHFKTFVCQNNDNVDGMLAGLKSKFIEEGKVCGHDVAGLGR